MSKKLGNLIKEARTAKGFTQAALAEKVSGITATDVSKIERGEKEPTQDVLKQIAKVLGVTQKSLLDKLTATEKKLVQLYRKADTKTKKAAINLLEGDSNAIELIGALMSAGKGSGSSGSSSGTSDLLNALLSGKTGGSGASGSGKDTVNALMEMLGKLNK